jgi:hypothetical protein
VPQRLRGACIGDVLAFTGSDTAALGGDLAYQHAKNGNLANVSINPAQGILGGAQFGTIAQTLQPNANLQDTSPRLG